MSVSEFSMIVDKILPFTDYVYLHVKGEPLLHPHLKEILDVCSENKLFANITTNGTQIGDVQDVLYHAKALRQINISLHSFENIDIARLNELDAYLRKIFDTATYLNQNTNTITAFRLWNLDKERMGEDTLRRNNYVLDKIEQAFPNSNLHHKLFTSNENSHNGIKLEDKIYLNFDYEFTWPSLTTPDMGETGFCYGLKNQLAILVDGTVVPCCLDGDGILNLGNIFKNDLSEVLASEISREIENGFAHRKITQELCRRCGYRMRFSK